MEKWALVPAVQGTEALVDRIGKDYGKIVLVYVVDSNADLPTASVGTAIKKAEDRIELIKGTLTAKEIIVKDYIEWGSWIDKLKAIMRIEQCDEVLVPKELSSLAKNLKKEKLKVTEL